MSDPREVLEGLLEESRALGFLGPGPVIDHERHSSRFAALLQIGQRVLDLGSGGGLPGLVLAAAGYGPLTLLDANIRRTEFLRSAVLTLGRSDVVVVCARAEEAGRDPQLRHQFDVVVARSFGRPAVTAECGAPFLEVGGRLFVSEPPGSTGSRWDPAGLAVLGLGGPVVDATAGVVSITSHTQCSEDYPRPIGRPDKRPLF